MNEPRICDLLCVFWYEGRCALASTEIQPQEPCPHDEERRLRLCAELGDEDLELKLEAAMDMIEGMDKMLSGAGGFKFATHEEVESEITCVAARMKDERKENEDVEH